MRKRLLAVFLACCMAASTASTVFAADDLPALAELPAKDVLQAQALGMMLAPITGLAIVLKAIAEKNGEPAEAEASAAE